MTDRPLIPFYHEDSWHFWLLYWTCGRLQRLPLELQRGHPSFPAHMDKNKEESLSAMQRLLSKFNHSDNCTYVYQLSHCKINTLSDYTCSLHLGQSPPRHDEFASLSVAILHCFVNARVAINISRIFCVSLEVVPIEHRFRSKCFISTHVEC
jgi:hypothetical protein